MKRVAEEPQRPRHQDVVVQRNQKGGHYASIANAVKGRVNEAPHVRRTDLELLAHAELEQKKWDANREQHNCVGHEECTTPVGVAIEWEAPEVAQADGVADARDSEFDRVGPSCALRGSST